MVHVSLSTHTSPVGIVWWLYSKLLLDVLIFGKSPIKIEAASRHDHELLTGTLNINSNKHTNKHKINRERDDVVVKHGNPNREVMGSITVALAAPCCH